MRRIFLSMTIALASVTMVVNPAEAVNARSMQSSPKLFRGKISVAVEHAQSLFMDRKYEEAATLFRNYLRKNPKDENARNGLGMSLAMQFKLDGADQEFDKALAINPQSSLANAGKATVLLNRLQSSDQSIRDNRAELLARAEQAANSSVSADPESPDANYALGRVLMEQARDQDAYAAFSKTLELDPQHSGALSALGQLDLKAQRIDQAVDNLQKSVAANSGNSTAHFALGKAFLMKGQTSQAIKELNTSLYQHRNSAPVHMTLGDAYESQRNFTAALKEYEKASLIKPELNEAYTKQADLHIKLGLEEMEKGGTTVAALKEFRQAVLIEPLNPRPYLAMADLRERRGDLELANSELTSGLELIPNDVSLRKRIGHNYLKMGRLDEAITHLDQVVKSSNDAQAVHELSQALYLKAQGQSQESFLASNEYGSAEATLNRAIKLQPNDLKLRLALAKLHSLAGRPVNLATVGTPSTVPERIAYAEALLAQNKFDESFQQMSQVIAQTKSAKDAISIAEISLLNMDHESAELAFKKAAELGSDERAQFGLAAVARLRDSSRSRLHLANDLSKRNQFSSAVDAYREAIAANPRLADARLGLARSEERLAPKSAETLLNAAEQLRAYMALSPTLPEKERARTTKKALSLEARAAKITASPKVAKK